MVRSGGDFAAMATVQLDPTTYILGLGQRKAFPGETVNREFSGPRRHGEDADKGWGVPTTPPIPPEVLENSPAKTFPHPTQAVGVCRGIFSRVEMACSSSWTCMACVNSFLLFLSFFILKD